MFSAILNSLVAFNLFSFSSFQVVLPINHLPWVFLSNNTLYYHSCCSGRSGHLAQQIMALTNLLFTPTKNNANWQRKPLAECCLCACALLLALIFWKNGVSCSTFVVRITPSHYNTSHEGSDLEKNVFTLAYNIKKSSNTMNILTN